MKQILIKGIGTKDFNLFYQCLCDLVAEHCYAFEIEDSESFPLDEPVKPACDVTINDLKWGQNIIKIYGHEWYDNGIWKLEIFNPFGDLIFKYKINDSDSDKNYTFEEFIEEAMQKYNENRKSV